MQEGLWESHLEYWRWLIFTRTGGLASLSSRSTKAMLSSNIMNGVWAAGVIVGIVSGVLLRMAELSPEQIDMLGFLGELMLRLLKMLVLPLVAGSMVAGNCSMHIWTGPCP